MTKMTAAEAAICVLEKEGLLQTFGVPGAAINPFYAAMKKRDTVKHILARHVEGASHMAEGYTRAKAGNIGVCVVIPSDDVFFVFMIAIRVIDTLQAGP